MAIIVDLIENPYTAGGAVNAPVDGIVVEPILPDRSTDTHFPGQIVTAGIPDLDGCKIFTRAKAFVVKQGVLTTLEHVFRDRKGNPLDMSMLLPAPHVSGLSESLSVNAQGSVVVRIKECIAVGINPDTNPVWELPATSPDPASGLVRVELPQDVVEYAGVYTMSWAIKNAAGNAIASEMSTLIVERSLFPTSLDIVMADLGPPTFQEIRQEMMDSSAAENVLLDNLEFSDDQLAHCVSKPVTDWNQALPPIRDHIFTTRTFPFREQWLRAIVGHLHVIMANHFRRNALPYQAAGLAVNDKGKEKEYMQEALRRQQDYMQWVGLKKMEINTKRVWGNSRSQYSRRSGF